VPSRSMWLKKREPGRNTRRLGRALLVACTLLWPGISHAAGIDLFGGWEGDSRSQGYGYLGLGSSVRAASHVFIPFGVTTSYLYYHYGSNGTDIVVRSPGMSLMSGLRLAGPRGSLSVMAGGEVRREYREPHIPGAVVGDPTTTGAVVQSYADLGLTRQWQASEFSVFVGAARYAVGRLALRRQVTNLDWGKKTTFFLGAETVRQGNADSDVLQVGGFAEWNLVPWRMSVGLHTGYKDSWSPGQPHTTGAYFGTSFYRSL